MLRLMLSTTPPGTLAPTQIMTHDEKEVPDDEKEMPPEDGTFIMKHLHLLAEEPGDKKPAKHAAKMVVARNVLASMFAALRRLMRAGTLESDAAEDSLSQPAKPTQQQLSLYEVEWGGFLTNHLSHGCWALRQLDAPATLLQRYTELYSPRLMPLSEDPLQAISESDVVALRGARVNFAAQFAFFMKQIAETSADRTLMRWLPELLLGLAGAAMHPIIHLAVGLRERADWLIAEGLAYLNHSHLATVACASRGTGASSSGLADANADGATFVEHALSRQPSAAVVASGRFQRAMAGLLHDADSVGALRAAVQQGPLRGLEEGNMLDVSVRFFVGQGCNDYFLLHAVTASWGLGVVLGSARLLPEQTKREAVCALAVTIAAAMWIQGVKDSDVLHQQKVADPVAALTVAREHIASLNTENEPRNEHVYKLVAIVADRLEQLAQQRPLLNNAITADLVDAISIVTSGNFTGRGIGERPTSKVDLGKASAAMHQLV